MKAVCIKESRITFGRATLLKIYDVRNHPHNSYAVKLEWTLYSADGKTIIKHIWTEIPKSKFEEHFQLISEHKQEPL